MRAALDLLIPWSRMASYWRGRLMLGPGLFPRGMAGPPVRLLYPLTTRSRGRQPATRTMRARCRALLTAATVRWLAGPAGIRQFLDIGTGIPNDDNVHAVALAIAPDA